MIELQSTPQLQRINKILKAQIVLSIVAGTTTSGCSIQSISATVPDNSLKVVIIRHGEKPQNGNNLSCKGQNRALQLPELLSKKSLKPDHTYVPSLRLGTSKTHARIFQAMIPSTIKYNLRINSELDGKDHAKITIH